MKLLLPVQQAHILVQEIQLFSIFTKKVTATALIKQLNSNINPLNRDSLEAMTSLVIPMDIDCGWPTLIFLWNRISVRLQLYYRIYVSGFAIFPLVLNFLTTFHYSRRC